MQVVLKEDVSPRKGWLRGRVFDWPRPTITAISTNLGHNDWYELAERVETREHRDQLRKMSPAPAKA